MAGDRVYLMGNGYAPTITVRNPAGDVVFREDVEFLPQDANMTSLGVIKVADGLSERSRSARLVGFFYPTAAKLHSGALTSAYPALANPVLTLWVYTGDLGIDDGTRATSTRSTSEMTQLTGTSGTCPAARARKDRRPAERSRHDHVRGQHGERGRGVGQALRVAVDPPRRRRAVGARFAIVALAGLLAALFVPRRRMWVKATPHEASCSSSTRVSRAARTPIAVAVADLKRARGIPRQCAHLRPMTRPA
jgi:cytochrome c biogenesis protein